MQPQLTEQQMSFSTTRTARPNRREEKENLPGENFVRPVFRKSLAPVSEFIEVPAKKKFFSHRMLIKPLSRTIFVGHQPVQKLPPKRVLPIWQVSKIWFAWFWTMCAAVLTTDRKNYPKRLSIPPPPQFSGLRNGSTIQTNMASVKKIIFLTSWKNERK